MKTQWGVEQTPMFPNSFKVVRVAGDPVRDDNAGCEYFESLTDAWKEARRRNGESPVLKQLKRAGKVFEMAIALERGEIVGTIDWTKNLADIEAVIVAAEAQS